jgi:hypothetical protein
LTGDQFDSTVPDGVQNWAGGEPSNRAWDVCLSLGYTGAGKYDDEACSTGKRSQDRIKLTSHAKPLTTHMNI